MAETDSPQSNATAPAVARKEIAPAKNYAAVVDQWFADHFHNPQMAGNPIYQPLYEAKEDLKRRLEEAQSC